MTPFLLYLVAASLTFGDRLSGQNSPSETNSKTASALLSLPLSFEPNRGQTDSSVEFLSRGAISGAGYELFLTGDSAIFAFGALGKDRPPAAVRMKLTGAQSAQISATETLPGKVNYFIGNDPKKWITGAPTYGKIAYQQVYPGIDLVYYGTQRQLEYDFVVAPGADPRLIALEFSGAKLKLSPDGALQLAIRGAPITFRKPNVYQSINGTKKRIEGGYKLKGNRVQFVLGAYDHKRALVIDPVLDYLAYLGGSGGATFIGYSQTACPQCNSQNPAQGVAVDQSGNLYVTGYTTSTVFPLRNAFQSQDQGNANLGIVFVSEINPSASALVYSTYLGGSLYDRGSAIAVDSSGNAYVTGQAWSSDFPVTKGAYQTVCSPEPGANNSVVSGCVAFNSSAFLTKLAPGGSSLVYSTFLGGSHNDSANAVALDSQGRAYIAGTSIDQCDSMHLYKCFPETANALLPQSLYNTTINPNSANPGSAFVAVIDAAGANLLYSTLYGDKNPSSNANNSATFGTGVAVDPSGNFYLTGFTANSQVPTTPGTLQPSGTNNQSNGQIVYRGFVAKFGPVTGIGAGAPLMYGTYLGGTATNGMAGGEQVSGIAVDASGNAYVTGLTQSFDFPVTAGANDTNECGPTTYECQAIGFLSKLNPSGNGLVWSTLVGPSNNVIGGTLNLIGVPRVDGKGNVYITGQGAYGYPAVNPVQAPAQDPNGGVFVTEYDPTGGTISFSTIIYSPSGGGVYPGGMDIDSQGNIYVGGSASIFDLPVTSGVFEPVCTGCVTRAGFLARINPNAPGIALVANAFGDSPLIAPNMWVEIKGSNLAPPGDTRIWQGSDFANSQLPPQLDGVSVMVNGKAAYVYYISPTQVNILTPPDAMSGPVQVQLMNNGLASNVFSVQAAAQSLSFFDFVSSSGLDYVYGRHASDSSLVGPTSLFPGLTTPVKPGETIFIAGTGFGPTNVGVVSGAETQSGTLAQPWPVVTIGGITASVTFAGLVGVGTYQFNVQVPSNVPDGDLSLTATYNGLNTQPHLLITVQR